MKKFREMKKNNKGFSLVELIVVIAIMVVLVAVLGSTILGYVDKSKYSKDIQALDSLKTAVSSYVADPKSNYTNGAEYSLLELLTTAQGSAELMDPSGVIKSTLAEVFSITIDANGVVTAADFNNSSQEFTTLNATNIFICIENGAVNIIAKVDSGSTYDNYTVGKHTFARS